jgi:type IV pilus assembly protein PilC
VELASHLLKDIPDAVKRCENCREKLLQGAELADALGETQLLTRSDCRLLTLGLRSGSVDNVMEQIASRMESDARQALEDAVSRVEPALVLVTSGLVGVILLSVMLPLMNIMTAIG